MLGITSGGMAFDVAAADAHRLVGCGPVGTAVEGVYCWSGGRGEANDSATTYLRSVGSIGSDESVWGAALFGAMGSDGAPLDINECAMEALGWSITRSLIGAIEAGLAVRAA